MMIRNHIGTGSPARYAKNRLAAQILSIIKTSPDTSLTHCVNKVNPGDKKRRSRHICTTNRHEKQGEQYEIPTR